MSPAAGTIDLEKGLQSQFAYATIRSTTMSSAAKNHSPSDLGDLEREVLELLWNRGPLAAETVREHLRRPLRESTVRTVLHRLELKGYLTHTVENRTYIYQAAAARRQVAAKAVRRIVDWFCDGSVEELLVGMVDTAVIEPRQLKILAEKMAKAKGGKQ